MEFGTELCICHPVIVIGGGETQGAGAPVAGADPVHHPAAYQPDEEGLDSHDERQVRFWTYYRGCILKIYRNQLIFIMIKLIRLTLNNNADTGAS